MKLTLIGSFTEYTIDCWELKLYESLPLSLIVNLLLFSQPPLPSVYKLIYQCLHHAVLPKDKDCAVEINFGTPEYGTALGRIFLLVCPVCWVVLLCVCVLFSVGCIGVFSVTATRQKDHF